MKNSENENKSVFQLNESQLKTILSRHMYFTAHNSDSEFEKLPAHLRRAINREAEFHVKTMSQVEGLSEILNDSNLEKAQEMHNALCEYFAHKGNEDEKHHPNRDTNTFAQLLRRDSDAIYLNPYEEQRRETSDDKSKRLAKKINEKISERKEKGSLTSAKETFDIIMNHLRTNSGRK